MWAGLGLTPCTLCQAELRNTPCACKRTGIRASLVTVDMGVACKQGHAKLVGDRAELRHNGVTLAGWRGTRISGSGHRGRKQTRGAVQALKFKIFRRRRKGNGSHGTRQRKGWRHITVVDRHEEATAGDKHTSAFPDAREKVLPRHGGRHRGDQDLWSLASVRAWR